MKKVSITTAFIVLVMMLIASWLSPATTKEVFVPVTSTRAIEAPTNTIKSTEVITPTTNSSHGGVMVKVVNVVDGDTIKVETGQTVRYIGIDTPETVHPDKPVMCFGKEASDKNTELVEGKIVELEKDVTETDKYRRLLRYVWLDGILINELLVREGFAQVSTYPPDVKYQDRFLDAQRLAREEQKGLWGNVCGAMASSTQTVKPSTAVRNPESTLVPQKTVINSSYTCNCGKTCSQMSSCAEAQYQLEVCGCSKRDADGDGIACDADCQ